MHVQFKSALFRSMEGQREGKKKKGDDKLRTMITPKSNRFVSPPSFRTSTMNRPEEWRTFCPHTAHVVTAGKTGTALRVRVCIAWSTRHVQWAWCPPGPDPDGPQYNSTSSMTSSRSSGCSDSESVSAPTVIERVW